MKIVFYTTTILEHGGGLEKYFIETAHNFSKFPDCQVDVVTLDDRFTERTAKLLSFYYFKKIDKSFLYKEKSQAIRENLGRANYFKCRNFSQLRKKLKQYDVIYSKNELLEAFIFKFLVGYKHLPPIIFGVHTPHFYPRAESWQSKMHNFLYGTKIYNFLTSGVKIFQVINRADEKRLKKQFKKRMVKKIYNPFDFKCFRSNASKYKFNFKFKKDRFNILWLGRLAEQKGVGDLVRIIGELNFRLEDKVVWNIIGEGAEKKKIISLKKRWQNINYFNYLENKYIPSIMAKNHLFILTSQWEAFPYTLIEAQAMNLPVISYDIPGPQDIIKNKVNGFLVKNVKEFKRAIINFVNHQSELELQDFYHYVKKKFNPDLIYRNLLELFKDASKN